MLVAGIRAVAGLGTPANKSVPIEASVARARGSVVDDRTAGVSIATAIAVGIFTGATTLVNGNAG